MAKKRPSSARKARSNILKQLNDPDFAGKKAVKNPSKNIAEKKPQKTASPELDKNQETEQPNRLPNVGISEKELQEKKTHSKVEKSSKNLYDSKGQNFSKDSYSSKGQDSSKEPKSSKQSKNSQKIEVSTTKESAQNKNQPKKTQKIDVISPDSTDIKQKTANNTKSKANIAKKPIPKKSQIKSDITPPQTKKSSKKSEITKNIPRSSESSQKTVREITKKTSTEQVDSQEQTKPRPKFDWRKTWRKHPMPAILRIPCLILLLAGASILFTWFILWRTDFCDADLVAQFIGKKPLLFSYSCLIIFFLMAVVAAVTWHIFFTIGFSFAVASVITFISMQKYNLREEPLLPSDFVFAGQTGNLISMVDAGAIWRLVIGVILILIGSTLLEVYACKMLGKRMKGHPWWERHSIISRAAYTAIASAGLVMVASPIFRHENPEWLEGLTTIAWDQTKNYGYNGFILDFVSNMRNTAAQKPENYSYDTMMKIAEKYWAIKEADDENRKPLNEVADRIFIVLNESFYDPSIVKDYYDYGNEDVIPITHQIFKNYPSGFMYSPGYGGGTANIEFEVQTGYSNYWANSYPYIDVVSKSDSILSVANWAKDYGFDTAAIHAFYGEMYNREEAYPVLGYDEFIDIREMTIHRYEPGTGYPNDNSIFDEILDLTDGNSPILANVVTMQNHGGYLVQDYPDNKYQVKTGERKEEATRYYHLLHASDEYLGEFIDDLKKSDEKSVVLMFGDHAGGIFPELAESDDKSERDLTRLTPYFIWANFDIKSDSKEELAKITKENQELGIDLSAVDGVDLPTTTPNCLLNQLYTTLNVEKPALFYLLDKVCAEAPIITNVYFDNENTLLDSEVIKEYELVNYDVMNGHHYWNGE